MRTLMDIYLDTQPVECPLDRVSPQYKHPSVSRDVGGDSPLMYRKCLVLPLPETPWCLRLPCWKAFKDPHLFSELVILECWHATCRDTGAWGRRGVRCRQACLVGLLLALALAKTVAPALGESPLWVTWDPCWSGEYL